MRTLVEFIAGVAMCYGWFRFIGFMLPNRDDKDLLTWFLCTFGFLGTLVLIDLVIRLLAFLIRRRQSVAIVTTKPPPRRGRAPGLNVEITRRIK
jgi:hypothetical protein